MDEIETKAPPQPDLTELQAQHEALRHLVVSLLVLAVIISGTLTIYLLRQWRFTQSELKAVRPQANQLIAEYQKVRGPAMDQFLVRLAEYAKTHPDFVPLLSKYGLKPAALTSSVPATASPPSTTPKAAVPKK